jgi:RimJ/RimL family protein N-acetyltransferase
MQETIETQRLYISPLTTADATFIRELVNSPGWIEFIGNRNINSATEANAYTQKILDNPKLRYWIVRLKSENTPIGVITFIKRDYLDHPDIGFAFLPTFAKKGYAYEAAGVILDHLLPIHTSSHILATTLPKNSNSIRLLEKLGFTYQQEINNNSEILHVYSIAVSKAKSAVKS